MSKENVRGVGRLVSVVALLCGSSTMGCAGGQKPAEQPSDPSQILKEPSQQEEEVPPSSPAVESAIAKIKAGQFAEAAEILKTAVVEAPQDPQAAFFYGVALEGLAKPEQAEAQYRKAIELQPKLIEASQNLSALLLAEERNEDALSVADAALQLDPKDPGLLANRALALDMLKRPEAIAAYEALLDVAPEDYNNRFNYAVALYLNDRPEEAKTELAKIQTTDLNLLVDVERLYLEMSDAPACIALWTWVYEKAPSAEALTHRARCKLMSGDKAGGEKDLRLAIEKEPQSSIAQYYLGKFLQKEGKKAEARKHFEQAAKVPDDFGKAAKAELKK